MVPMVAAATSPVGSRACDSIKPIVNASRIESEAATPEYLNKRNRVSKIAIHNTMYGIIKVIVMPGSMSILPL